MRANKTVTRRAKALCLAAVILKVMTPAVFAQTEADFTVELTGDGAGVVITGYTGKAAAVKIPAAIQGMPVREIGPERLFLSDGPFHGKGITSVVIPAGVTLIGQYAFADCGKLAQVTLPETLATICGGAFSGCRALQTINLPDSVTDLGGGNGRVFAGSGLRSVTLPKGLKTIDPWTFEECDRLAAVVIPEGVTEIREFAFSECGALASLTLPSTITSIGAMAFSFCSSLSRITIPDSVSRISFDSDAFVFCPKLTLAAQAALKKRGYDGSFSGY
jgi:hypothetical protein